MNNVNKIDARLKEIRLARLRERCESANKLWHCYGTKCRDCTIAVSIKCINQMEVINKGD